MKKILSLFILLNFFLLFANAQEWNTDQLVKANTAINVATLTKEEKETILYLNLARLYPKDFVKNELKNSRGTYANSLIRKLESMKPLTAMVFDEELYEFAKCYAKEMGEKGTVGHNRKKCKNGNFAECCSYGMDNGKDIILQLLIDENVPSLGHRKICLSERYSKIGVSIHKHKTHHICAVLDII